GGPGLPVDTGCRPFRMAVTGAERLWQFVELRLPRGPLATPSPAAAEERTAAIGLTAHLSRSRLAVLGIAATIIAAFLSAVIVPYAFSDVDPLLRMAVSGRSDPWFGNRIVDVASAGGRPLEGVFLHLAYSAAGTIDNLRFVRLISVLGIVALALL